MKTISAASFVVIFALGIAGTVLGSSTDAQLLKEAKISKAQAEKTALAKVRHGAIKSGELEREHGKLLWSFDIAASGTKNITEVQVDARDGKILSIQTETPSDQAKEAAADAKAKK